MEFLFFRGEIEFPGEIERRGHEGVDLLRRRGVSRAVFQPGLVSFEKAIEFLHRIADVFLDRVARDPAGVSLGDRPVVQVTKLRRHKRILG